MRDERSAGYAADAYARVARRTGICDATVGPGVTNLVSPVAEAYASSIPVIAIISDIPRAWEHRRIRGNASQALKQIDLFTAITKWQATVTDCQSLDDIVDTAFRIANTGRPGPVVLCIPDEVFSSTMEQHQRPVPLQSASFPWHRTAPDPARLQQAAQMIQRSRKPVLLVGGGAIISGAFEGVQKLAERLNAPVATTISGKGIIEETNALSIGVAGSMGRPIANEILSESDLVIFIGTKAGQVATLGWDLPKSDVPTIHIDVDPEEVGRNFRSLPLIADAHLAIIALLAEIEKTQGQKTWQAKEISKRVRDWYENAVNKKQEEGEPLKPQIVMDIVNHFVTEDDLCVCDASLASGWAALYYCVVKAGYKYLAPRGLAGLGWGAPAAIGSALATGKSHRVLLFAGDGGFAYSVQELEVMSRLQLPVIAVIFNNDTLGWIKHIQRNRFKNGYISTDFRHVDFSTVAQGFGARGYVVHTTTDLHAALERERFPEGPAVIDVNTDQWETPVLRSSSMTGEL
jgi:acetolactate synthase-1/2/3 large subunit